MRATRLASSIWSPGWRVTETRSGASFCSAGWASAGPQDQPLRVEEKAARGERVLADARHSTITTDHPDAVMQAIRDLLEEVRRGPTGA
jgi:hypothetical protein